MTIQPKAEQNAHMVSMAPYAYVHNAEPQGFLDALLESVSHALAADRHHYANDMSHLRFPCTQVPR